MTLGDIEGLGRRLQDPNSPFLRSTGAFDKIKFHSEIETYARAVQVRLLAFSEVLTDPRLDGKLQLGVNPEKIEWRNMSVVVAHSFKPEFTYQPDEITSFYIRTSDHRKSGNEVLIEIALERLGQSWSSISMGATVGDPESHHFDGTLYARCYAPQAQPKAARDAMDIIHRGLWSDVPAHDEQESRMLRSLANLKEADLFLNYAFRVLDKRVTAAEKKSK